MIMVGSNITSPSDVLLKTNEDYLFHSLRNPKPAIAAQIRQLRTIYQIDPKSYVLQKRMLPYFVCGIFNPTLRKLENFAYTETFIVDIDHITEKGINLASLRKQVESDSRVLMCFTSPSEDGLKVMFRLKERCYDAGLYSIFYKEFVKSFSTQHNLNQVVDSRTSDATRACFVSIDKNTYYNKECDNVDLKSFVDTSNPLSIFDTIHSHKDDELNAAKQQKQERIKPGQSEPEAEIMAKIKQKLNPNGRATPQHAPAFVPAQLENIMEGLTCFITETGLEVSLVQSIQYGKKIHVNMGAKEGEVNIFYGKRGFSVVKSTKCGTCDELNEALVDLSHEFLSSQ